MEPCSRSVLYELLSYGLVDIRAVSVGSPPMSSEQGDFVNSISNLLHNLPGQLEKATTDEEYDEILRHLGPISHPIAAEWLDATLEYLGIDPSGLT